MAENIPAEYDYKNIDNYIKDNYSVCREERQYALLLYNILSEYGIEENRKKLEDKEKEKIEHIFQVCGIKGAEVKHVFFEATFMRDFFKRDRRCAYVDKDSLGSKLLNITCKPEENRNPEKCYIETEKRFNYLLLKYVLNMLEKNGDEFSLLKEIIERDESDKKEGKSILDLNLGGAAGCSRMNTIIGELKDKLNEEAITKIKRIQIMMNIKPDIAVIFEREDGVYLKFLECKFESSEGSYNFKKDNKGESYFQTEAQNWVGEFLCKELRIKTEIKDDKKTEIKTIEWEGSELIYFRRQKSERENVILLEEMMHFCRIPK